MEEIYINGPVVAVMRISPDFYMYNSGVYEVRGKKGVSCVERRVHLPVPAQHRALPRRAADRLGDYPDF